MQRCLPVIFSPILGCVFTVVVSLAGRLLMYNRVLESSVRKAFGEWSHDLWGHFINYICDIQPDEFPLWLNDMMNINDLRWITLLLLLLLLMIMCFMTLREREGKGKLHTTADLGHADFHMQQDQGLGWESKFYYFAVVDETACQRGETAIQELIVYSNSQAQTGICFLFSSSTLS